MLYWLGAMIAHRRKHGTRANFQRAPNRELRTREYLTEGEVGQFLKAAKGNRYGSRAAHCDGRSRGRYGGPLAASHRGAIAKTVAELSNQQDGRMRQQLIEHLMREIMNYDAEFRSEEATGSSGSIARH